jgi:trk system potassium uptake protein
MKQYAVIGLGRFGVWALEELLSVDVEVLIVDRDENLVARYKDRVQAAYVADILDEQTIRRIIPGDIDAVIIDLGDRTEASILAANYLKKMGVRRIVARAETDGHGEILSLVGATDVVYPNREAAKRVMPALLSDALFSYMPISPSLVMAEVSFPRQLVGKTFAEADLRATRGLNVVATKPHGTGEYIFVTPTYQIASDDTFLVVGSPENLAKFGEWVEPEKDAVGLLARFFRRSGLP